MKKPRKSSVDSKLDALSAKKSPLSAKTPKRPPQPVTNRRGMARYGRHADFETLVAAIDQDIARLAPELQRARRKRRSLLAAQRQRCRYEQVHKFRTSERMRRREAYRDKFKAPDDFKF